jgi:hypothetical protein
MWANSVWGFFGLAVTLGLAVIGLSPDWNWLRPYFLGSAAFSLIVSLVILCWPLRSKERRVAVLVKVQHPFRWASELIEPHHIIVLGLLIVLAGVIWQWRRVPPEVVGLRAEVADLQKKLADATVAPPDPVPIVVVTPMQQVSNPASGSTTLRPNEVPSPSGSDGVQAYRYIKLQGLISDAQQAKSAIEGAAEGVEAQMKSTSPVAYRYLGQVQGSWNMALMRLKTVNDLAYSNRPMNLETISDASYLSFKVPGEEAFGDNVEKLRELRGFHWLNVGILKEADALLSDMKKEAAILRESIKNGPAASLVGVPK